MLSSCLARHDIRFVSLRAPYASLSEVEEHAEATTPAISQRQRATHDEHIKDSEKASGSSTKRAKEVAARTVNKHHRQKGHAKGK